MSIPGWNSIDSVRRVHSDLEFGAILFFALLVTFEVLAHLSKDDVKKALLEKIGLWFFAIAVLAEIAAYPYGQRSDALSAQVIGSLDVKAQRAADNASKAVADSSDAEIKSGAAFDKADVANKSASTALNLATGARREADSFENDIVSAKKQAAEAESHLAEALRQAAEAQAALDKLRTPRTLTPEQRKRIASKLESFTGVQFDLALTNQPEPADFSLAIENTLEMGGWTEIDWKGGDIVFTRKPRPTTGLVTMTGVIIQMHKEQVGKFWAAATTLAEELRAEGIDARAEPGVGPPNDDNNAIHILIGEKPK